MTKIITIKKGLDIKLKGEAEKVLTSIHPKMYAVKPTDFHGVLPKLLVSEGDRVLAGSPLFFNKHDERVKFVAPVSGVVQEIRRGAKRLLEEIVIEADEQVSFAPLVLPDLASATPEQLVFALLEAGVWPSIRQRPYNVIANPDVRPKAVFVSAFDSAPLAPDCDFMIDQRGAEFQLGLDVLAKMSGSQVHLNVHSEHNTAREFLSAQGVQINRFCGPHPAGNAGVQIHHLDPMNKGEVAWVVNPMDVAMIGKVFATRQYNTERVVALAGWSVRNPRYYRLYAGACIDTMVKEQELGDNLRYISGNVLTGHKIRHDGFLGYYDYVVTLIPEGNQFEFFGWAKPGFNAFSYTNAFFSKLFYRKPFAPDTNLHGGERAFVMTGQYEKVLPMDIYPMQLLKAIMVKDIDLMESLGIYEVDEEDFALCEVVCTSKTEVQSILREGLDMMRKEMS
jgi:Na+-transporting NADH:ubiquinone oxidoreductase subunit A